MARRWVMGLSIVVACGPAVGSGDGTDGSTEGSSGGSGDPSSDPSTTIASSTTTVTSSSTNTTTNPSTTIGDSSSDDSADTSFPDMGGPFPDVPQSQCDLREPIGAEQNGYIWISNSTQSTVSKIDVHTLIEEGRYLTRPDGLGNPSRTSVNRNGDVAVANRNGGITMIRGNVADCDDPNATSTGPNDVLPWPDGCIVWHTPMQYQSQRPVAWTAGTLDEVACDYIEADVWTSGANLGIDVLLLDGETGAIEEMVTLPPNVSPAYFGIYGGAVDSGNHFWGSQLGTGHLVRVDHETFEVETWMMPIHGYGIAIDTSDRPWTCAATAARFDYATQTWEMAQVQGNGGCAPGNDNVMWLASTPVVGVDMDTMQVVSTLAVPEYVHGVSMDFDGYVWGVTIGANAYRIDPGSGLVDTVTGFVAAYTYSDMTGTALAIAHGQL